VRSSRRWQNAGDGRIDRVEKRARALQSLVGTQEGVNLLAGYKRAANILKKEQFESGEFALSYTPEPAEKALIEALESAGPQAAAAVAREDFSEAMAALASLRAPIDAFFDSVTVNDADPQKRAARLSLLAQFRDAVHSVADFSKIEG
jgi:glycyl-tRNA synthetase beta chain